MINGNLHLATNRRSFLSPLFPESQTFVPRQLSPAAEALRRTLRLDFTAHDYYVVGALAALYSFPVLVENCPPEHRTFGLADYHRLPDSWKGVRPIGDRFGPFMMRRRGLIFPIVPEIKLTFVDLDHMRVTIDNVSYVVPVRVQEQELFPEWPAGSDIQGGLATDQEWGPDFKAVMEHIPISYPYDAAAEVLRQNALKNEVLLQTGLQGYFMAATTGMERVATAVAALIMSK